MPLYEYQCESCGQRFEVIQKFSDPPADVCKKCGKGPVIRLQSSPAIQFKGTGWYITDYAQKGKSGGSGDGQADAKKDGAAEGKEGKSESKSADKSGSGASESTSKSTDTGTKTGSTSSSKE
jgi:putative FmdB family regulatory protein